MAVNNNSSTLSTIQKFSIHYEAGVPDSIVGDSVITSPLAAPLNQGEEGIALIEAIAERTISSHEMNPSVGELSESLCQIAPRSRWWPEESLEGEVDARLSVCSSRASLGDLFSDDREACDSPEREGVSHPRAQKRNRDSEEMDVEESEPSSKRPTLFEEDPDGTFPETVTRPLEVAPTVGFEEDMISQIGFRTDPPELTISSEAISATFPHESGVAISWEGIPISERKRLENPLECRLPTFWPETINSTGKVRGHNLWSKAEDDRLRELSGKNLNFVQIHLRGLIKMRTADEIKGRMEELGLESFPSKLWSPSEDRKLSEFLHLDPKKIFYTRRFPKRSLAEITERFKFLTRKGDNT